jgi:hypothetical protein
MGFNGLNGVEIYLKKDHLLPGMMWPEKAAAAYCCTIPEKET